MKVSFYLMCSLLHYSDCPGSTASISCLTASLASLFIRNGGVDKSCSPTWEIVHWCSQSSVSCKLVISCKCIQCILGTISSMLHCTFWFAVLNSLISWKIGLVTKYKKNSHTIYLDSHLVTFWPNSTQQVPLSYSQELQSIHATVDFEKSYIWWQSVLYGHISLTCLQFNTLCWTVGHIFFQFNHLLILRTSSLLWYYCLLLLVKRCVRFGPLGLMLADAVVDQNSSQESNTKCYGADHHRYIHTHSSSCAEGGWFTLCRKTWTHWLKYRNHASDI